MNPLERKGRIRSTLDDSGEIGIGITWVKETRSDRRSSVCFLPSSFSRLSHFHYFLDGRRRAGVLLLKSSFCGEVTALQCAEALHPSSNRFDRGPSTLNLATTIYNHRRAELVHALPSSSLRYIKRNVCTLINCTLELLAICLQNRPTDLNAHGNLKRFSRVTRRTDRR